MARTVTMTEGRALDHIYDPTTVVSGARDFNRRTAAAAARVRVRVPVAENLFSELPHYPRAAVAERAGGRGTYMPANVPLDFQGHATLAATAAAATPPVPVEALVHGTHRYKYAKRPNVAVLEGGMNSIRLDPGTMAGGPFGGISATVSHESSIAALPPTGDATVGGVELTADGQRSIAIQTLFRDSQAQTDPYTPEYVVPPNTHPEVLRLANLKYGGEAGQSLPAGKAEVEAIELARRRARVEASLPPTTDEASFAVRKRLMEEMELDAWLHREAEIDRVQEGRLAAVESSLRTREAEREFVSEQRVEELRRTLAQEQELANATLQQKRVKLLRKLGKQRRRNETHVDMLTGTGTFVGVTTGSKAGFGKGRRATRDIIAEYADYGSRVYAPSMRDGRFPDKLRAAAKLEVNAPDVLDSADQLANLTSTLPPRLLATAVASPTLEKATTAADRAKEAIARDLERIHHAIKTVQAGKSTTAVQNEQVPAWRRPKPVIERPPTPTFDDVDEGPAEEALERAVLLLQTLLRGRAVQNVMYEGKERRLELIHEMRADLLTPDAAAAIEEEEQRAHAAETRRIAKDSFADAAAGEVTAAALDFFSKELLRQKEMQRISAQSAEIVAERARREQEESQRRAAELAQRREEQERLDAELAAHAATAVSFVDKVISDAIGRVATEVAGVETAIRHSFVGPILDRLEHEAEAASVARRRFGDASAAATVVKDLLTSLVVPAVNMEMAESARAEAETHFAAAAAEALAAAATAAAVALESPEAEKTSEGKQDAYTERPQASSGDNTETIALPSQAPADEAAGGPAKSDASS